MESCNNLDSETDLGRTLLLQLVQLFLGLVEVGVEVLPLCDESLQLLPLHGGRVEQRVGARRQLRVLVLVAPPRAWIQARGQGVQASLLSLQPVEEVLHINTSRIGRLRGR